MNDFLNSDRQSYIFYHLNLQHFSITNEIKERFSLQENSVDQKQAHIYFRQSNKKINTSFRINNIPVLFPLSSEKQFYYFDKENNLIFEHDILKSAFFLLSGYQETQPFKGDFINRYSFNESIQKELEIIEKPIVNEYFKTITEAIKIFCNIHNIKFTEKKLWADSSFGFMLTHDIDRIDKWSFKEVKRRIKLFLKSISAKHFFYLLESIYNIASTNNPFWNFKWLKELEKKFNFKSTWFFLPQGHPDIDADYSLKART